MKTIGRVVLIVLVALSLIAVSPLAPAREEGSTSMPARQEIDIVVKGHDQATPALQGVKMTLTDIKSALDMAGNAARTVGQIYEASVGELIDYATEVRQMSSITGEGAEATSRMIQVFGDFEIEGSQVTMMLRTLGSQGLSPTIETIATLSDRYLAIHDPIERATFLQKNFGRSGADLALVMEQGSEALLERNAGIEDGLVLTQSQIDQAEEMRQAEDDLRDAWKSLVTTWTSEALPTLVDLTQGLLDLGNAHIYAYGPHGQVLYEVNEALGTLDAGVRDSVGGWDEGARAIRGYGGAIRDVPTEHNTAFTATFAVQVLDDYARRLLDAGWWSYFGAGGVFTAGSGGQTVLGGGGPTVGGAGLTAAQIAASNAYLVSQGMAPRTAEQLAAQVGGGLAEGGPLGFITEVGEAGTEGIIGGVVVPHDMWEWLKRMGLEVEQHAQGGGDFFQRAAARYTYWQQQSLHPEGPGHISGTFPPGYFDVPTVGGGTVGGGGTVAEPGPVIEAIIEDVKQSQAEESAALVASIPTAAATAASEQSRVLVGETRQTGRDMVAKLDQVLRAINKLNETFPTVVRDAIERVV